MKPVPTYSLFFSYRQHNFWDQLSQFSLSHKTSSAHVPEIVMKIKAMIASFLVYTVK